MKRFVAFLLTMIVALGLMVSCQKPSPTAPSEGKVEDFLFEETEEPTNFVKIEMTDGAMILVELYPDVAPITVENFKNLVAGNFYDGLIFHRVIAGFMIQGGDPKGTGYGGTSPTIKGEFAANGVQNDLKHERGVISMARTNDPNSASCQFFIMHEDDFRLDGQYAAFGKVIAGMDTVDKIASVKTNVNNRPLEEQKMKSIRFVVIDVAWGDT